MITDDYKPRGYGPSVDESRCRANVTYYVGSWPNNKQCDFKPKDGTPYCRIHQPDKVEERRRKVDEASNQRWEADKLQRKFGYDGLKLKAALEQIRDGHNDPRALAKEVLDRL